MWLYIIHGSSPIISKLVKRFSWRLVVVKTGSQWIPCTGGKNDPPASQPANQPTNDQPPPRPHSPNINDVVRFPFPHIKHHYFPLNSTSPWKFPENRILTQIPKILSHSHQHSPFPPKKTKSPENKIPRKQ